MTNTETLTKQQALFEYLQRLGDDSLILGHRLSEWCGHGPELETDIAMINVALDLIGQARSFLLYAGEVEGKNRNEDDLAYLRLPHEFRNANLVEQENGHFGTTIARSFLFDIYHYFLFEQLAKSNDEQIAAIAAKALKEVTYHVRFSSEWVIRLGDGTNESHQKIQEAFNELWMYVGELFQADEVDELLLKEGIAADLNLVKQKWEARVKEIFEKATLTLPENDWFLEGGRKGIHTERLGYILAEMQYLSRAYPGAKW